MSNYECSLQGLVIGQEQKDYLIERLTGICGNDAITDLYEHEIVFTPSGKLIYKEVWSCSSSSLYVFANILLVQTPVGPGRNDDVVLRVQSRISNEQERSFKFRQW